MILHDLNGNNAYDADPQTGMPTDGFVVVNAGKSIFSPDFNQQITFDQIKFHVGQPETSIEAVMDYPPGK